MYIRLCNAIDYEFLKGNSSYPLRSAPRDALHLLRIFRHRKSFENLVFAYESYERIGEVGRYI